MENNLSLIEANLREAVSSHETNYLIEFLLNNRRKFPFISDEFSAIRYIFYLFKKGKIIADFSKNKNPFIVSSFLESCQIVENKHFFDRRTSDLLKVSYLYGLSKNNISISLNEFTSMISDSDYINSVLKDLQFAGLIKKVSFLKEYVQSELDTAHSKKLKFLIEMATRLKFIIPSEKIMEILQCKADSEIAIALINHIAETERKESIEFLLKALDSWQRFGPAFLIALIDVLGEIGNEKTFSKIESFSKESAVEKLRPLITQLLNSFVSEKNRNFIPYISEGKGLKIAQFMFYGDPMDSGKAGSGGLGTLLMSLGNNIPFSDTIESVFTLVTTPVDNFKSRPLVERLSKGHILLRLPIFDKREYKDTIFLEGEDRIKRAVKRAFVKYAINPDILHVRYSDNASKIITELGKELNKKTVFTVTPDPHRRFCDSTGKIKSPDAISSISFLNSVYIADTIIKRVDGILGIGTEDNIEQLISYFPQFIDRNFNKKPHMVPEGIDLEMKCNSYKKSYLQMLYKHKGFHTLTKNQNPIIITVGRLHPLKGQVDLLKAWGDSELHELYNLVFIGGDFDHPGETEGYCINEIREYLFENPNLEGSFCHIPAIANEAVRCLEKAIIAEIDFKYPNIYISSSYKEEFGIAILEAMAAGFLAIGPGRGGVKGYIEDGKNGFLIDTLNHTTIAKGMNDILKSGKYTPKELKRIAASGKDLVHKHFGINKISEAFAEYYESLSMK